MAVVFLKLLLFLMFTVSVSVGEKFGDDKDSLKKKIQELSVTELSGFPDMGWKPLDPFELEYWLSSFAIQDPDSGDYYNFLLRGLLSGSSNFTVDNITINEGLNDLMWVNITSTTGPISFEGRFIVNQLYEGAFQFKADSATREEINIEVIGLADGTYFVQDISPCTFSYTSVNKFSLNLSGLPDNITQLLNAAEPSDILSQISSLYIGDHLFLLNDMLRHQSIKSKEVNLKPITQKSVSKKQLLTSIGDIEDFFTRKVEELSSTELNGFPTTGWDPIDPLEFPYILTDVFVPGAYFSISLMGSMSGWSNFVADDINVTQNTDSISVNFTATTGPISVKSRYVTEGYINGTFKIFGGIFELTADSTKRTEIITAVVAPDGSYFVYPDEYIHLNYFNVINWSLNISDLPSEIEQLVRSMHPEDILNQISGVHYVKETFLFNDMIRYKP